MAAVDLPELSRRFLDAQLAADRTQAIRIVIDDGVRRGATVPELLLEVIRPAQREIGRLWQENSISIADEHQATAISQLALAQLYSHADRRSPTGRRVLVACVQGEQHDMGARIASDLLDGEGHDVLYLGADVPVDALLDKVRRESPDVVVLSITMAFHAGALRAAVERIRREVAPPPVVAAGGRAFVEHPELASQLDLDAWGEDATTLVADLRRRSCIA